MSYLDVPRLHFSGSFTANPSTLNNDPTNFDPANANAARQTNAAWNPDGNGAWKFPPCTVRTAVSYDGKVWNKANPEPIIGATFASTDSPAPAKLVDLDTEQQMVSQIWGLQLKVFIPNSGDFFVGNFRPISFNDVWFRVPNGQQDWTFSAYFQSVIDVTQWSPQIASPVLRELWKYSGRRLSIKFVVDNYQDIYYQPDFTQGRVVGTIGPSWDNEPQNFLLGRQLRPVPPCPPGPPFGGPLYYGYARVDAKRRRLLVDLGNSIPTQADTSTKPPSQLPSAPPVDLGTLGVAILPQQGGAPTVLGKFDYSLDSYCATANVAEYPLTDQQVKQLTTAPFSLIGVVQTSPPKDAGGVIVCGQSPKGGGSPKGGNGNPKGGTQPAVMLQESPTGAYINATRPASETNPGATCPVLRMAPGDKFKVELVALRYGQPAAGETINLASLASADNPGPFQPPPLSPLPPEYNLGTPASGLTFSPQSVKTDANGRAVFEVTAGDPGNPRKFIEGQLYAVGYIWDADQKPLPSDPNTFVTALVFDSYKKEPTWENIQPFMEQYAWLYPFMDGIFPLNDPKVIQQNIAAFRQYLSFPITDPRHMPVTRDLSPGKRQALLKWLAAGAPFKPTPGIGCGSPKGGGGGGKGPKGGGKNPKS